MSIDYQAYRALRGDIPRSHTPPRPPKRRWIPTRLCRCDGDCRFRPLGQPCAGTRPGIQLYETEGR